MPLKMIQAIRHSKNAVRRGLHQKHGNGATHPIRWLAAMAFADPVPPSPMLQRRIKALRVKQAVISVLIGAARIVGTAVALIGAGMLADWWFDLPRSSRTLLLLVYAGIIGSMAKRWIYDALAHQPDDDTLALMVEKEHPALRSRLIATIQLTRPRSIPANAHTIFVRHLIETTEVICRELKFGRAVKLMPLIRSALVAALVAGGGTWWYHHGGQTSAELLQRAFLSNIPVPRRTRVICLSRDLVIAQGGTAIIEARADGAIPASGTVHVHDGSGQKHQYEILPTEDDPAQFRLAVENVMEPFSYVVALLDGRSEPFRVVLQPRPAVTELACSQEYPSYTRLGTVPRTMGDLTLLAGSKLLLRAAANKKIQNASVRLAGVNVELPATVHPDRLTEVTATIPVSSEQLTGFSLHLTDAIGLDSRDEALYRIDVVPDRAPTVRVIYPERKEELVTSVATILFAFEVSDDYGISRLVFKYRLDNGESAAVQSRDFDLGTGTLKLLRRRHEWALNELVPSLAEGKTVEYWLEAHDANDVTGPGVGTSEHRWARVVSPDEKRAEITKRMANTITSVEAAAQNQADLTRQLGNLIFLRPASPQQ